MAGLRELELEAAYELGYQEQPEELAFAEVAARLAAFDKVSRTMLLSWQTNRRNVLG